MNELYPRSYVYNNISNNKHNDLLSISYLFNGSVYKSTGSEVKKPGEKFCLVFNKINVKVILNFPPKCFMFHNVNSPW